MDQVSKREKYRQILRQIIAEQAGLPRRKDQVELVPICDTTHDNYLLMRIGWDRVGRAHHILIHLRLKDGKVWVEWDGLEHGVANDLLAAGIPKDDIVMALYGREPQPLAELAAA